MTVIRPNSVSGINSITAQANEIKIFKSDGTQGGLMIDGANLNATSGISTVAALTVTGNVSVGGTLTYQDVTNIDSVGVITARDGINISGGNLQVGGTNVINSGRALYNLEQIKLADTKELVLGSGDDLKIYHDGNHSRIKNTTGQLWLQSDNGIRFTDSGVNESMAAFYDNGAVELYYDGTKKFETTSGGAILQGKLQSEGTGGSTIHEMKRTDSNTSGSVGTINFTASDGHSVASMGALGDGDNEGAHIVFRTTSAAANNSPFNAATPERLRILSDGKVAIGGVTANSLLDVHGGDGISITHSGDTFLQSRTTGTTGTNYLEFKDSGGGAGAISYHHNGNSLRFKVNGAERARIDSDGHLQIRLEGIASMSGQDTRHTRYIIKQTNNQEAILGSVFAQGQSGWGGDLVFATKDNNGNPSSGLTERMRLDHTGKLIIKGESNAELNLKPGSGSGNDIISFENSGGTQRGNITYDTDNNFLFFNVSQSERTRIDQNGTLSHGTTQDNPGDANSNTGFAIRANGKYFFSCAADGGHMNRNNAGYVLHARYGGNFKGGVSVNSTNTSFQTSSDYRLKENVVNLDGAITRVKQLTPRRFNFIVEPDTTVDGFLAHEAATVVPEAVTGTHNEVDDDGNPVYQCIDQGKLVPLLTAALQEAIAKIETLEAAVTALQGS